MRPARSSFILGSVGGAALRTRALALGGHESDDTTSPFLDATSPPSSLPSSPSPKPRLGESDALPTAGTMCVLRTRRTMPGLTANLFQADAKSSSQIHAGRTSRFSS